jgi:hypothetical protein
MLVRLSDTYAGVPGRWVSLAVAVSSTQTSSTCRPVLCQDGSANGMAMKRPRGSTAGASKPARMLGHANRCRAAVTVFSRVKR